MSIGVPSTSVESLVRSLIAEWPEWSEGKVRGEILYYNSEQKTLEQISHVNFTSTLESMRVRKLESNPTLEGEGLCSYVARTHEAVLVPHVRFDRRYRSVVDPDYTQSELVAPLEIEGRLVGVINLESDLPQMFGNRHLKRINELAPIFALQIEYETYRFEEEFMQHMTNNLSSLGEESAIFTEVLHAALDLTGRGGSGAVLLPDREEEPKWLRVSRTVGLEFKTGEERPVESFGIIRKALHDSQSERYWSLEEHGTEGYVPLAAGIRCEFVAVLRLGHRTLAVIDVESTRPALSERYKRAIQRCSRYAVSLVEGLRRRAEAERNSALNDGLAGVKYETHIASYYLGKLIESFGKGNHLSAEERDLIERIGERLLDGDKLLRSFMEVQQSIDFREVVADIQERAIRALKLRLEVNGDFGVWIKGNRSGFIWLFENLISNTLRYARGGAEPRAWLYFEKLGAKEKILYWDNGEDPEAIEKFLSGRSQRQGWSHIQALCRLYRWEVEVRPGETGQLLFEFIVDLQDPPRIDEESGQ